ncbi:pentapeptide repeat-containing protein (plasmid) [Paraclostridium ghonii]|uniref:pentapeptide repeat-containing protein n=1 Tax=Paraclostridium ghonii TaxID=29358 RepID=UPI00202CC258|nr:pentapeptide repeat-containing protein [Paeniclostridium ghonii]MCM0165689.1 pentapeptide repeat-containing protein [Paeniclostridium ghonii]
MRQKIREVDNKEIFENLKINCEKCFGLCCIALYFSKTEGFPNDKVAGKPCINLQSDFNCSVHSNLREKGLTGCTAYDCFGAGQNVSQVTFNGDDWINTPKLSNEMFDSFLIIRQLNEMLWYLSDASTFISDNNLKNELNLMILETTNLTNLDSSSLKNIDIENHRKRVNSLLRPVYDIVKDKVSSEKKSNSKNKKALKSGYDFIGSNLINTNLIGANFAGSLLIASNMRNSNLKGANLIGADLRDADIRGANLKDSLFLTQAQINTAKGNSNTQLPTSLVRPSYWEK